MSPVFIDVASSQIARIGYAAGEGWNLYVEFKNGGLYRYRNVDLHDILGTVFAPSVGKAFDALVKKGGYEYQKVEAVTA